jgi:MFS transporter, FHS family, L-fucose permease
MAITNVPSSAPSSSEARQTNKPALAMMTTLFFMWGFLTVLNDILVPHLKSIFELNYFKVMLIQFAFFSSYFIFAVPWGRVIDRIAYQKTMVAGLLTMALGAFLFIPAASVPSFPLFLAALIVLACGMTALQVAANPYVAVLGPSATASSRLNLAQAFNSLGTTIGPYIGGLLILSAAPKSADILHQMTSEAVQLYRQQQASSVKLPYLIFAAVLLALSIAIGRFKLPAMAEATHHQSQAGEASLWEYRHLVLGAVGIFTYVGAEVAIGSFLINYLAQPSIGNMSEVEAARYVSYYWGGAMVGRFIGSAVLQTVKTSTVVATAAILACFLVITSMLSFGHMAVWSIILVGLFNSIMFPSIFTMGIEKLGPRTGDGSGILIMAIVGGAIIPVVQGAIADRIGIHHAFFLPAICYLYILYYALRGSRPVLPVSHGGAMAQ